MFMEDLMIPNTSGNAHIINEIKRMRALFAASFAPAGKEISGDYIISPSTDLSLWLQNENNEQDSVIVSEFSKGLRNLLDQDEISLLIKNNPNIGDEFPMFVTDFRERQSKGQGKQFLEEWHKELSGKLDVHLKNFEEKCLKFQKTKKEIEKLIAQDPFSNHMKKFLADLSKIIHHFSKLRSLQSDNSSAALLAKISKKHNDFLSSHGELNLKKLLEDIFLYDFTENQKIEGLRQIALILMDFKERKIEENAKTIEEVAKTLKDFGFKAEKPLTRKELVNKKALAPKMPPEEDILGEEILSKQGLKAYREYQKIRDQKKDSTDPSKSPEVMQVDKLLRDINKSIDTLIKKYSEDFITEASEVAGPINILDNFKGILWEFLRGNEFADSSHLESFLENNKAIARYFEENLHKLEEVHNHYIQYLQKRAEGAQRKGSKKLDTTKLISEKQKVLAESQKKYAALYNEYTELSSQIEKFLKLPKLEKEQSDWILQAEARKEYIKNQGEIMLRSQNKLIEGYSRSVKDWIKKQRLWSKQDEEQYSGLLKNNKFAELKSTIDNRYTQGLWDKRYQDLHDRSKSIDKGNVELQVNYKKWAELDQSPKKTIDERRVSPKYLEKERSALRYQQSTALENAKHAFVSLRDQEINSMIKWLQDLGQWTDADAKSALGWMKPNIDNTQFHKFHQYVSDKYSQYKNDLRNKIETLEKQRETIKQEEQYQEKYALEKEPLLFQQGSLEANRTRQSSHRGLAPEESDEKRKSDEDDQPKPW